MFMVLIVPSTDAVKAIHDTFIKQYGIPGYMYEGMVEGSLERAMTYIYDFKPFPKLFLRAAAILHSIIVFHPFVDGNKRTAFETTKIFLLVNGYELIVAPKDGVDFTKAIAELKITKIEEIAEWLEAHSKRKFLYTINVFLLKILLLIYSTSTNKERRTMPKQALLLTQFFRLHPE
jgi:death-on-curing protein